MKEIGIGVIGTAFMGKAHSIAYASAGTAFVVNCAQGWKWCAIKTLSLYTHLTLPTNREV